MSVVSERDHTHEIIRNLITVSFTKSEYIIDENGDMIIDITGTDILMINKHIFGFNFKVTALMMVLDPELMSYNIRALIHLYENSLHISFIFNKYYPEIGIKRNYLEKAISRMNNYIENRKEVIKIINKIKFDDCGIITTKSLELFREEGYKISDTSNVGSDNRTRRNIRIKFGKRDLYTPEKIEKDEITSIPYNYSIYYIGMDYYDKSVEITYIYSGLCNIL